MRSRLWAFLGGVLVLCGCSSWNAGAVRSQSPEEPARDHAGTPLVGELAVPYGLFPVTVENVGLVTGLRGTGCDPQPSPQRQALLSEMQTRGVVAPNTVLASGNASLVLIRGVLRPGIQKGDRFDVEVRVPSRSETSSLRGGYLLETRLREMAVLDNAIHEGHLLALASGPLLVDPAANAKTDPVLLGRGRILGGGVCLKSRPLALVLKPDQQSVLNSSRVETAVNKRFYTVNKGVHTGVAKAKTDQYVELVVHPRYKDNIERFVQVARSIALRETEPERIERMERLRKELLDPATAAKAALQLEAIGQPGAEVLRQGLQSGDAEVRFRSAEALAYLDDPSAAEPLAEAARSDSAFRVFALAALAGMNDFAAAEQLHSLLVVPSAETRYGAFRALSTMNANDPAVMGEDLGDQFSYHVLNVPGPPMIHVTRSRRPEVVLFGADQHFSTPLVAEAGNQIMLTSTEPGKVIVAKFAPNEPDQKRFVSDSVDEVIRAIVDLGGTYPDVVQALQEAKNKGALAGRFEVDALPEAGRTHDRTEQDVAQSPGAELPEPHPAQDQGGHGMPLDRNAIQATDRNDANPFDSGPNPSRRKGFLARIMGRP